MLVLSLTSKDTKMITNSTIHFFLFTFANKRLFFEKMALQVVSGRKLGQKFKLYKANCVYFCLKQELVNRSSLQ